MLGRLVYKLLAPMVLGSAMLSSSLHADVAYQSPPICQDNNCNAPCDPCDPYGRGYDPGRRRGVDGYIIGAAAIGGVAGVIAGVVSGGGSDGSTGPTGPTGPAGPGPFVTETGTILSFAYALTVAAPITAGSITPFVETPDGETVFGVPFAPAGLPVPQTLLVTDPVYGTYHFGLVSEAGSIVVGGATALVSVASSTRPGEVTTYTISPGVSAVALVNEVQSTEDFTYGPPGTLP